MKKEQKTTFTNRDNLNKMLNLRIIGFSTNTLAFMFKVHRTDLTHYFKKYLIETPEEVYDIPRINNKLLPKQEDKWMIKNGERINKGKSYKEYLREYYSHISNKYV